MKGGKVDGKVGLEGKGEGGREAGTVRLGGRKEGRDSAVWREGDYDCEVWRERERVGERKGAKVRQCCIVGGREGQ